MKRQIRRALVVIVAVTLCIVNANAQRTFTGGGFYSIEAQKADTEAEVLDNVESTVFGSEEEALQVYL